MQHFFYFIFDLGKKKNRVCKSLKLSDVCFLQCNSIQLLAHTCQICSRSPFVTPERERVRLIFFSCLLLSSLMHFSGSQRKLLEQEGSRRLQIRSQGAFWYLAWLLGVSGWSQSRSRVSAEVMNKRQTRWRSIGGRGDNKLRGFINTQIWGVFLVSFRLFFLHFISHLCMKKCQFRCWPRMCFKGGRAEKNTKCTQNEKAFVKGYAFMTPVTIRWARNVGTFLENGGWPPDEEIQDYFTLLCKKTKQKNTCISLL